MSRSILLCVVLVGCGFKSTAAPGPGSDAAVDTATGSDGGGSGDGGTVPADCLTRWRNGTVKLEVATPLANQSSAADDERDPWVSSDGLTLYYTFDPAGGTKADIYRSIRTSTSVAFPAGTRVDSLDSSSDESRASLTADQLTVVLTSNRANGNIFQVYYATRASTDDDFSSVGQSHVATLNAIGGNHYDPFLSADGLQIYFAPAPTIDSQHIYFATRGDPSADFGPAVAVPVINGTAGGDADPALSPDLHILVFSSNRGVMNGPTGGNLWYATRNDVTASFDPPKLVPDVNGDDSDGDPFLSADGCTLYFASTRGPGTTFDLYSAQVELSASAVPR